MKYQSELLDVERSKVSAIIKSMDSIADYLSAFIDIERYKAVKEQAALEGYRSSLSGEDFAKEFEALKDQIPAVLKVVYEGNSMSIAGFGEDQQETAEPETKKTSRLIIEDGEEDAE